LGDLIRNGAKTISLQTLFGRLNKNKKRSKNNKSPKLCLGDLINNKKRSKNNKSPKLCLGDLIIIIRNGAKTISLPNKKRLNYHTNMATTAP
jgi:hypothetical protein